MRSLKKSETSRMPTCLERVANAGRGQFVEDTGGSFTVTLLLSML